jgi:hypothetical protein
MHVHHKTDVPVIDPFIQKFAERYLKQRSQTVFDYTTLNQGALFENLGFDTEVLRDIVKKNAVAIDINRERGIQPHVLNDIYRSDLGELLMTYYFEEKLPDGERFIIPLKNITFRERADMPGRGLDAIGYKIGEGKIEILLGEAKVSESKQSPPAVVDAKDDSIYKTQKHHHDNLSVVIQRLSDFSRRLNGPDAAMLGFAIVNMSQGMDDKYSITYGCTLIRDYECVNEQTDFGKMKTNAVEFEPGEVHFSVLSFQNKTIQETVKLFYEKVQILIAD